MRRLFTLLILAICLCASGVEVRAAGALNEEELRSKLAKDLQAAKSELAAAHAPYERWLGLTHLVVLEAGSENELTVRGHIDELLKEAPQYVRDWNYGNAVHKGNLALGRLALRDGDLKSARRYLLEAGKTPGSPQLDSFGPNMLLAHELFARGERTAILQYFDLCRRFWQMGGEDLDKWTAQVKAGTPPDFGANLLY